MQDNPKLTALISLVAIYTTADIALGIGLYSIFYSEDVTLLLSKKIILILGIPMFIILLIATVKHLFDIYIEFDKFEL